MADQVGEQSFLFAIKNNNIKAIEWMLDQPEFDPSCMAGRGYYLAMYLGHKELAALLIQDERVWNTVVSNLNAHYEDGLYINVELN